MPIHRADGSLVDTKTTPAVPAEAPPEAPKPVFVAVPGPTGPTGPTGAAGGTSSLAFQTQFTWHINELTGDNAADGATSGSAIRDSEELLRRVGAKWRINTTVHIYLDSNITDLVLSLSIGKNGVVYLHGKNTITRTGTVTAFTDENVTSEPVNITDTGKTWTPGTKLRTTSGSNPGAWAWIAKDKGSGVARTEKPGTLDVVADPLNSFPVSLSPGDNYNIETQCVIQTAMLDVDGAAGIQQNKSQLVVMDCDFVKLEVSFKPITFVGCKFRFFEGGRVNGFTKCCFTGILLALSDTGCDAGLFLNIFFFLVYEGQWFFNTHSIFQNAAPLAKPASLLYFEDYGGFFDVANPIVVHYGSRVYARHGLYGQITGTAITVQAGGQFRWSGTVFSFTGQTNDVSLGGNTSLPRIDPATNISDGTPVLLSFTNLLASFGSGGFGGSAHDLYSNASFLQVPDDNF